MRPNRQSPKIQSFRSQYYGQQPPSYNRHPSQKKLVQSPYAVRKIKTSSLSSSYKFKQKLNKIAIKAIPQRLSAQIDILQKEIQRLQKDNYRKSRQLITIKNQTLNSKHLEAEIKQLYNIISYYEGKTKELQHQLQQFFNQLISENDSDVQYQMPQIQDVIKSLSLQNRQLSAKLEQSKYQKHQLQNQIRKYQSKYYDSTWKLSATKRTFRQSSKSPIKTNELQVSSTNKSSTKQQQSVINKFAKKIQKIEIQLQQFKRENDKLHYQIQLKEQEILQLKKDAEIFSKLKYSQSSIINDYEKELKANQPIYPISTPSKKSVEYQKLSKSSKNINTVSKKNLKQTSQKSIIEKMTQLKLRKLRFQLMLSPLPYSEFIDIVKDKFQDQYQLSQTLKAHPYLIPTQCIVTLNNQLSTIKQQNFNQKNYSRTTLLTIISKFLLHYIPPYKNFIKDDRSKNSAYQKAKDAINVFYEQLYHFRNKNQNKVAYLMLQDALRDYGCKQSDIDCIFLHVYLKGMLEQIDLSKLWKIFEISQKQMSIHLPK